jgi:hypothetical protein
LGDALEALSHLLRFLFELVEFAVNGLDVHVPSRQALR